VTVLDTDFLIALGHRRPGAMARSDHFLEEAMLTRVPAIVWLEFLIGVAPEQRLRVRARLAGSTTLHPFGSEEAERALDIQTLLSEAGTPMSWNDLQVAASALVVGEPLVTNDKAFQRVPGLQVEPF